MLEVQTYLNKNGLQKLQDELSIKVTEHEDGRLILNYNQIDSPKLHPIVRECRGLVLDSDFNLVARAFPRFFNLGETEEDKKFVWDGSTAQDKEDGSLLIVYHWEGKWHINTRGSYGDGLVGNSPLTWRILAEKAGVNTKLLSTQYTYVFELCSLYNKVVRQYRCPAAYLLTVFYKEEELTPFEVDKFAYNHHVLRPESHLFGNVEDVTRHIDERSTGDATWEGLVLRDINDLRVKVKSKAYVELHRISNNGNIAAPKNLIQFIIDGETAEVLNYFPELSSEVESMEKTINKAFEEVRNLWFCYGDIASQKKFALKVKDHPLASVLFSAKKLGLRYEDSIDDLLSDTKDVLLKRYFGG